MWGENASYCGRRNSNSGATVAYILGNGGANHSAEFEGTLVMGDEIFGNNNFKFYLFAGFTASPYDEYYNRVAELDSLAQILSDDIPPEILYHKAYKVASDKILLAFTENISSETAENTDNYQLSGFSQNYEIISAHLHHNRGITLKLNTPLAQNDWGDITVVNVCDLNGNAIEQTNNTVHLYPVIPPHIVGSMNQWNPANHQFDLQLADNGLWSVTLNLPNGEYQYKIIESDEWNGNDWPSQNQTFTVSNNQPITIYANCGLLPFEKDYDEFEFHSTNPPMVCSDFLSELGGEDWDVTSAITYLNDNATNGDQTAGDGLYSATFHIPTGNYQYKIVLNNNWDQNTSSQNLELNLSTDSDVTFYYDMSQNVIHTSIQANSQNINLPKPNNLFSECKIYPNLYQPNLKNGHCKIEFSLSQKTFVKISLFNIKGEKIKTIVKNEFFAGKHKIYFDAKGLKSGIYFVNISSKNSRVVKKMVLTK